MSSIHNSDRKLLVLSTFAIFKRKASQRTFDQMDKISPTQTLTESSLFFLHLPFSKERYPKELLVKRTKFYPRQALTESPFTICHFLKKVTQRNFAQMNKCHPYITLTKSSFAYFSHEKSTVVIFLLRKVMDEKQEKKI